jgi:hypothetical protein
VTGSVRIIIPWRPGDADRERAAGWLIPRLHATGVAEDVLIAGWPADEPWSKGATIARALSDHTVSDDEIVVLHDADVWCDGLRWAVQTLSAGAPWVTPHRTIHRLTADATRRVLSGAPPDARMACTQRPYRATPGGGVTVVRARHLRAVPIDPRFVGWGGEDLAWAAALRLIVGREVQGPSPLWHLHHEPQPRIDRHTGSPGNAALLARYQAARRDRVGMEQLLEEARGRLHRPPDPVRGAPRPGLEGAAA